VRSLSLSLSLSLLYHLLHWPDRPANEVPGDEEGGGGEESEDGGELEGGGLWKKRRASVSAKKIARAL